jgi:hypothetical protein
VSSLAPGESLLLVGNRPAFELRYGAMLHYAGKFSGQFNNAGEQITLVDGAGLTIVGVTFDDENGWPTEPDGNGPTLELANPDADPTTPAAWTSGAVGGSPGSWTDPRTPRSIDVDDNGTVDGMHDGLIIVRYMFEIRDEPLTHGALGNGAQRTDPAEIAAYLGTVLPLVLDVDEDTSVRGMTDGVLLLRYCFEFRGEPLTHGALGDGAQRTDPAEIAAYLEACCQAKSSSATTLDAKGEDDSPEAAMRSLRLRFHDKALEDFRPEDLGSLLARRRR